MREKIPPFGSLSGTGTLKILYCIFQKKSTATGGIIPRVLPFASLRFAFGKILFSLFLLKT